MEDYRPSSSTLIENYNRPETSAWLAKEAVAYWESLDQSDKQGFLTVSATCLAMFPRVCIEEPWLADFLSDAMAFYEIHSTWDTYVCPNLACSRLFKDDESLIIHLKCDHFSDIHPVAWPPRRHNLAKERRCADALREMVWKPIVVEAALDLLSTMCLDHEQVTMADVYACSDQLYSLDWLFSEDLERMRLLLELKEGFQVLLAKQEQASISLISDGFFMTMTSLASKHIFVDRPPRYNLCFLQCILAQTPLSFCLLEARHLSRFVKLVEVMSQVVKQPTLHTANQELVYNEGDFGWSESEILDALSGSVGENLSVSMETGFLSYGVGESIPSSLSSVPPFPSIQRIPNKDPVIFSRVQKILECMKEGRTDTRLGHQISQLKHQIHGPVDISQDSQLSEMGVDFNPGCTSHLQWEPYCCFRDPDKLNCIESHFERELYHLELVNELQCLESQLRQLCAVNCRTYILLILESFLRLKFYASSRWPYKQSQMISYQEGNAEQKVSSDESKSECSSDYDTDESCFDMDCGQYESESEENSDCEDGSKSNTDSEPETESELDDKPWRGDPTLCRLDLTLSESATGETEGTGPFFWIPISGILRHCEKYRCGVGCNSLRKGIRRFRLNKTWKYWLCYSCDESFTDRESHMVHLEDKHQLCLAHDDYWLIPKQDCQDEVEELKQDEVKSEPSLEDSITLHHKYRRFLVDSTKFDQIPEANEEGKHCQAKRKKYMEIVDGLHSELCDLRRLFRTKRKYLMYLEVVNALSLMLFNGGQPLALIVCWLRKLSIMERHTGTTHQLQFRFLSQLLCQAHDQRYGPLSNKSVQNAFQNMRENLISKIDWQDQKILEALDRIDDVKRNISDICVCDYRTEIVPSVRSFLHAKFKFDDSLKSLGCNNIKELLSSLDQDYIRGNPRSFSAQVVSPGKVVINTRRKKLCWGLAFIGISLDFVGEWRRLSTRHMPMKISGIFNYGALFTWPPGMCRGFGRVINCSCESRPSMEPPGVDVDHCLYDVVHDKFYSLNDEYFEQNR